MHVRIVEFPLTRLAALEHRGPVERLNDSVARFIDWRQDSGLSPVGQRRTFGIAYDDPSTTCRIPDDCIDEKRHALFVSRAMFAQLIEDIKKGLKS